MLPTPRTLLGTAFTALALLLTASMSANNIQVTNFSLTGNTGTSTQVRFDLSWENSWRGGGVTNWDAAWVFVKYRSALGGPWQHANLNNTGHVAATGSQIDPGLRTPGTAYNASTNPVVGVFIYRDAAGNGNLSLPNTQLNWNYSAQGLAPNDILEVQVFALEMVYVNQGAFHLATGGTEQASFTDGSWTSGASITYQVTSENAIQIAQSAGNLWALNNPTPQFPGAGPAGTLPSGFPKGFAPFYCLKYELSNQAYVDFLNTLSYTQQTARTTTAPNAASGSAVLEDDFFAEETNAVIRIEIPGVASGTPAVYGTNFNGNGTFDEANDGADIACYMLSWGDITAYMDWAALRPMSEFEFQKTCRGTIAPVANEYAWGTATLASSAYTLANAGASNEGITTNYSTTSGNALYISTRGSLNRPLRVGIFSANATNTGRVTAGASYYGVMELSGNTEEPVVVTREVSGRSFTGMHGDGALTSAGAANVATWPGSGTFIGGDWGGGGPTFMMVSNRNYTSPGNDRIMTHGGRGVRSAQ